MKRTLQTAWSHMQRSRLLRRQSSSDADEPFEVIEGVSVASPTSTPQPPDTTDEFEIIEMAVTSEQQPRDGNDQFEIVEADHLPGGGDILGITHTIGDEPHQDFSTCEENLTDCVEERSLYVVIGRAGATPCAELDEQSTDLPPEITSQPQSITCVADKSATFSVTAHAAASDLSFQWESNKKELQQQCSNTKDNREGEAMYQALQCSFNKLCNEAKPEVVAPSLFAKKIIGERAVEKACNKHIDRWDRTHNLLLDVMRVVRRKPEFRHEIWRIFEDACVPSIQDVKDDFERLLKDASGWKTIPSSDDRFQGAPTSTLTIKSVQSSDQGMYQCVVSNSYGSTTSSTATLTLIDPISIITQPQDQVVAPGSEVKLTVEATGTEATTYTWMHLPLDRKDEQGAYGEQAGGHGIQGEDAPVFSITGVTTAHQGSYWCEVSNADASDRAVSNVAKLTVAWPPEITTHPHWEGEVLPGEDVTLKTEAEGTEPLQFKWQCTTSGETTEWNVLTDSEHIKGTATPELTLLSPEASMSGGYRCVVGNTVAQVESNPVDITIPSDECMVSRLMTAIRSETLTSEQKVQTAHEFVQKHKCRTTIIEKGLMAVIAMEREEEGIIAAFTSCFVRVDFMLHGVTPLHCACRNDHHRIVRLLLENGAQKNTRTQDGARKTPLHIAAEKGCDECIRVLLENKVDVHLREQAGSTALHLACVAGHITAVKLLVLYDESTADGRDADSNTPLHLACKKGDCNVVQAMAKCVRHRKFNQCLKMTNKDGKTPVQIASDFHHSDVLKILKPKWLRF